MTNEAWNFVQAKSKQAMKQVRLLGIRDEKMRMKVTPPLAVAPISPLPIAQEQDDDMRWNPNDDKGPSVNE